MKDASNADRNNSMSNFYKVYYIQHSTFLIELEDKYLLFDYFDKNVVSDMVSFEGSMPELNKDKKLYVFASHSHKDHFSLTVFDFVTAGFDVKYILSKDIRLGHNYLARNGYDDSVKKLVTFVKPDKKYDVDGIKILTLRSNDAGVAFSVEVDGLNFYHSGDLNWWNTEGRGELYGEQYGREYKRALHHIKNKFYNAAFVVLDPRLNEDGYFLGMDYFIKNVESLHIFPMHMWGQYEWIDRFMNRPDIANLRDRIVVMDQENMIFEIED